MIDVSKHLPPLEGRDAWQWSTTVANGVDPTPEARRLAQDQRHAARVLLVGDADAPEGGW